MSYLEDGYVLWPVPPDWDAGVREQLEWLTDVIEARTGAKQKRELRLGPRRQFTFEVIANDQARRVLDMILADHGSDYWLLPIWHDVQLLPALDAGVDTIPCKTEGFELVADSLVVVWASVNNWWLAAIEDVGEDYITTGLPTDRAWPAGSRLYPVRLARLDRQPEEAAWTDTAGTRSVVMQIEEPSDWPAVLPATMYQGWPVLDMRPDTGDDLKSSFARMTNVIDEDTGAITIVDRPGRAFREQSLRYLLGSRAELAAMRSLLYGLRGRAGHVWVPSWAQDLLIVAPVTAVATTITIEWAGYSLFGRAQPGRRDIRIELTDGTVLYRRITAAVAAGANETLTIDSALGRAVQPHQVLIVSFMALSELASDRVELLHETDGDGLTEVKLDFLGVRRESA